MCAESGAKEVSVFGNIHIFTREQLGALTPV